VVRPPYPAAVRLCTVAAERWAELDAHYYQINLLRQRPHRYANLIYAWCIERVPSDKLDDWLADLVELLPWQDAQSQAAEELESASFMSMMGKSQ
jgi:hypothetical protein